MKYEDAPSVAQQLYDQQIARERGSAVAVPTGKKEPVAERTLIHQLELFGIEGYVRHYPSRKRGEAWPEPIEKRRWSFDFAWVGLHRPDPRWEPDLPEDEQRSWNESLGIWLHGSAHGHRAGDKLRDPTPGKRGRDYEAANVLGQVLPPLGWTLLTFSNQQVGSLVTLRSIEAWLAGDDDKLLQALQGKS